MARPKAAAEAGLARGLEVETALEPEPTPGNEGKGEVGQVDRLTRAQPEVPAKVDDVEKWRAGPEAGERRPWRGKGLSPSHSTEAVKEYGMRRDDAVHRVACSVASPAPAIPVPCVDDRWQESPKRNSADDGWHAGDDPTRNGIDQPRMWTSEAPERVHGPEWIGLSFDVGHRGAAAGSRNLGGDYCDR